jgi:hypothetical protein
VIVETVIMVDWKFAWIHSSPLKRDEKYGAAARNMFLQEQHRSVRHPKVKVVVQLGW